MPFAIDDPVSARRALAHALSDYLDKPRVKEAVALWSVQFEGRGSLFVGLNRYCRQVATSFDLPGKEAELHLRIFRALQTDASQLPDDPLSEPMRLAPAPAVVSQSASSAGVIEAFFDAVEVQVAREPAGRALRSVAMQHARVLPPPLQRTVMAWWSGASSGLAGNWPPQAGGTRVINVIYVALAECLGPTKADQIFTNAVGRLENSSQPSHRQIRSYL